MRFFDNRINYDILITKRKRILSVGGRKVKKMKESFPKAVKVENIANILKVTFENGEVKYVKSHWTEEITDALQFGKKGRGKRKNLLALSRNSAKQGTYYFLVSCCFLLFQRSYDSNLNVVVTTLFCTQSDSGVFFRCHSCRKMTAKHRQYSRDDH